MKKVILLCLGLLVFSPNVKACDICGCSGSNSGNGIIPQFKKNFIGLMYGHASFQSKHLPDLISGQSESFSKERFQSLSLWGRWHVNKRLQLFASIPYSVAVKNENDKRYPVDGWGDVSLWGNFIVIDNNDSQYLRNRHFLSFGSGVKFFTGSFNTQSLNEWVNINMLPSTGTNDVLLQANYAFRRDNIGLSGNVMHQLMGQTATGYDFANRTLIAADVSRWINTKRGKLLPKIGYWFEYAGNDRMKNVVLQYTGYQIHNLALGLEYYTDTFGLLFHARKAMHHHVSLGLVNPGLRMNTTLIYFIKQK